jgi:hypothetical protein
VIHLTLERSRVSRYIKDIGFGWTLKRGRVSRKIRDMGLEGPWRGAESAGKLGIWGRGTLERGRVSRKIRDMG